jgi:ketosteroid isomerase-like protein
MAFEGPVEDRLAIRERVDAYCDAVFRRNADDWIACWAEDGVWKLPGMEVSGREAMKPAWIKAMSAYKFTGFFGNPGHIVVDGDTAEARVYTTEYLEKTDGAFVKIFGAYDDRLVKRAGAWVFSSRTYTILRTEA